MCQGALSGYLCNSFFEQKIIRHAGSIESGYTGYNHTFLLIFSLIMLFDYQRMFPEFLETDVLLDFSGIFKRLAVRRYVSTEGCFSN
jgi:hypothetical protein